VFTQFFTQARGFRENWSTLVKREALAAVNWMTYYANDKAMLEALNPVDIRFFGSMFDFKPDQLSPEALI
jgi:hypothetical protein